MHHVKLTRHARQRLQQRGARTPEVAIVITHGDIELPARHGCRFLRLSHSTAASLLQAGMFRVQDIDRARRLIVLLSGTDEVVTAVKYDPEHRFPGRRGRR